MTSDTTLPDPLTPPDCDLRGMEWMPLHGHKLYGSDFDAIASDAEYRAAQRLWWAAWQQQVPAASLPDDDRVLAHVAGYQRDPKGWAKVRDVALHAFVKCSDGRLYHRFLAPEAVTAWEMRRDSIEEKENMKERQRRHREHRREMFETLRERGIDVAWNVTTEKLKELLSQDFSHAVTEESRTCHGDSHAPDTAKTGQDRTGQDNLRKKEREESPSSLRSEATPSSDDAVRRLDKRGSRLPADWQPGETGMSYALCHLRPDKIHDEIEKFRNYWHAKAGRDATKLDWNATWRNWVLTAKQHTPTPRETAKKPSPMAWMFEEAERRKRGESIPTIDTTGRTLQ